MQLDMLLTLNQGIISDGPPKNHPGPRHAPAMHCHRCVGLFLICRMTPRRDAPCHAVISNIRGALSAHDYTLPMYAVYHIVFVPAPRYLSHDCEIPRRI